MTIARVYTVHTITVLVIVVEFIKCIYSAPKSIFVELLA